MGTTDLILYNRTTTLRDLSTMICFLTHDQILAFCGIYLGMKNTNTPEYFWSKIKIANDDDCWLWTQGTIGKNYGQLKYQNKFYMAHRLAYILAVGSIEPTEVIAHLCKNNSCCNPKHLIKYSQYNSKEKFWSKVNILTDNECWIWTASKNKAGYGVTRYDSKKWTASRLAYFLSYDNFNPSLWVCHHCDNPPCCNPKHLFLGTPLDNAQDKVLKGRCGPGSSILTIEDVVSIRSRSNLLELAIEYGVKPGTIFDAIVKKSWNK